MTTTLRVRHPHRDIKTAIGPSKTTRWLLVAAAALTLWSAPAYAKEDEQQAIHPPDPALASRDIQDNSFLVEEAYNQELGVVQHYQTFQRTWPSHDWFYAITQEWPVGDHPRHQLSYTIPFLDLGRIGSGGLGDINVHYRYQLVGSGETPVAFSPRLTLLLPTGDSHFERGNGGFGIQVALPVSVVIRRRLVTHWNAGGAYVPSARDGTGDQATTWSYSLGQSLVWLVKRRFNVLLETTWTDSEGVVGPHQINHSHVFLLSPGIRWAHNLRSGLQIVPGIALPQGFGPSAGEHDIFLYLSFEHPFRHVAETHPETAGLRIGESPQRHRRLRLLPQRRPSTDVHWRG
jgi:hypothetical protein